MQQQQYNNNIPACRDATTDPPDVSEDCAPPGVTPVTRTVSDSVTVAMTLGKRDVYNEPRSRSVTFFDNMGERWLEKRKLQRTPTPYWPRKEVSPTDDDGVDGRCESFDDDSYGVMSMPRSPSPTSPQEQLGPDACAAPAEGVGGSQDAPIPDTGQDKAVPPDFNLGTDQDTDVPENQHDHSKILSAEPDTGYVEDLRDSDNKDNQNNQDNHHPDEKDNRNDDDKSNETPPSPNSPKSWKLCGLMRSKEATHHKTSTKSDVTNDSSLPELQRNPLFRRAAASFDGKPEAKNPGEPAKPKETNAKGRFSGGRKRPVKSLS